MLKFKNKFKFGTSGVSEADASLSAPESLHSNSPRNSTDSRKTISMTNLSDGISKVSLNDSTNSSTSLSPNKSNSSSPVKNEAEEKGEKEDRESTKSGSEAATSLTAASSVASTNATTTSSASQGTTSSASSPGLLTVKIYNSQGLQLPIDINNNKQILQALASNASNELTTQQLWKNLSSLQTQEQSNPPARDILPGSISANFLPSIITIPNGDNLVKSLIYLTIEFDNNVLVIEPQKGTVNQSTWNQVVSFDVSSKNSSKANGGEAGGAGTSSNFLNLNLFIRLPSMLIPESEKSAKGHLFTNQQSRESKSDDGKRSENIGDLLIGTIKLPLNLNYHSSPIRLMNHEYLKFRHFNLSDKEMGDIMLTIDFKPILKKHLSIEDFDLLKVIGKGSFGKVMQVIKKDTKQIYALKTLRKQHIISRMEVTHTLAERTVLARISNPFIVPLKFSFQSPEKLYLVLSFINGGELFWHLQKEGKFSMDRSRFYIAELLTALESLHDLNVIYRDLKPENILLDYQGHIALCDFGLCKLNMANNDKTNTFCGTPEYLAPELLLNQGYTRSVDWWTLGTLLYEMLTGLPPFYDDDVNTMYGKILRNPLRFPSFLEGTDAQDLLVKLLQKDPNLRTSDAKEIKNHKFFSNIDWNKLLNKSYLPPFKPNVENLLDTSNFDSDFTNEKPQDSVVDDFLSESVQKQFGGWTYNGDNILN
ncbi:serine/threonine-protein kinase Ypk2p/YKR2 [[Candida] railenensis]|uniref:non-specific serine/threonine protein kinase n=1 Tax=[Candida] railenensis TaxID=45579 RepID=A0A9P0VWK8_9ASCO|nr:serine/threonine-protein kinase Ypk2p/YKR2 [[Candida] railenensis]